MTLVAIVVVVVKVNAPEPIKTMRKGERKKKKREEEEKEKKCWLTAQALHGAIITRGGGDIPTVALRANDSTRGSCGHITHAFRPSASGLG